MKKANLPWLLVSIILPLAVVLTPLYFIDPVQSATALNVVISEIKLGPGSEDFVELYNPTGSDLNLAGWKLTRKASTGTESNLVASMSGIIKSHGFFLLTNDDSTASSSADLTYASALANNNTILLYSNDGISVLDKVGMGSAVDFEATTSANPADGKSIERKANPTSTDASMTTGADVDQGNGEDTNNNLNDFILRDNPNPQNSSAAIEPPLVSPSPSASPIASASPSASPSISPSPLASPSVLPSASSSANPSASPIVSASPSASVNPSIAPQGGFRLSCSRVTRTFKSFFFELKIPIFSCRIIRN